MTENPSNEPLCANPEWTPVSKILEYEVRRVMDPANDPDCRQAWRNGHGGVDLEQHDFCGQVPIFVVRMNTYQEIEPGQWLQRWRGNGVQAWTQYDERIKEEFPELAVLPSADQAAEQAKAAVLAVHPDASAWSHGTFLDLEQFWKIYPTRIGSSTDPVLGVGPTNDLAWINAASRLPAPVAEPVQPSLGSEHQLIEALGRAELAENRLAESQANLAEAEGMIAAREIKLAAQDGILRVRRSKKRSNASWPL